MKPGNWVTVRLCAVLLFCTAAILFAGSPIVQAASLLPTINVSHDSSNSLLPKVAQDPDGNVHVVWVSDSGGSRSVLYAKGTWNGSNYDFSSSVALGAVGGFGYAAPNIAVAPNGTVLAAWSPSFSQMLVKTWNMRAGPPANTASLDIGIRASIAADANNHFHIVGDQNSQIQYCEFDGTRCLRRDTFPTANSTRPDVAVDSTDGVHVVWDTGQTVYYRARGAGADWGSAQSLGGGNAAQIAADGQGSVHIVWSSNYDIQYCRRTLSSGCTDQYTINAGDDLQPSIGATPNGNLVVGLSAGGPWFATRENGGWSNAQKISSGVQLDVSSRSFSGRVSVVFSNNYDIQHATVVVSAPPPPTPPSGSLTLNNGATFTNQTAVNAQITNSSTTPATTYSLADGTDPGTPSTPFTNPTTNTTFNLTNDGQCRTHTVVGRLGSVAGNSATFSAAITYDPSVDASVLVRNPNLSGNQSAPIAAPATVSGMLGSPIAPNAGESGYTPFTYYALRIGAGAAECSGLRNYSTAIVSVPSGTAPGATAPQPIANNTVATAPALKNAENTTPEGIYQVRIGVADIAGNSKSYPSATQTYAITYDATGPAATLGTGLIPTGKESDGMFLLNLAGLNVWDKLYPDKGTNQHYWGYWVLVRNDADPTPSIDDNDWQTRGIVVGGQVPSTLRWNVAMGMVNTFKPGANYKVLIRFIDGAGNPSNILESQALQVNELTGPRLFLPIVSR